MSFILTLAIDDTAQARFETERQRWFPPERNVIAAHLTLFHTLPETDAVIATLRDIAATQQPFIMQVTELKSIGRGVAYFLTSPQVSALHRSLSNAFREDLSAQDKQGFRPHVVVQNKAGREAVAEVLVKFRSTFTPFNVAATGLDLWRYLNGPWQHIERYNFGSQHAAHRDSER